MQDPAPDSNVFIINKLKDPVPEALDVPKDLAWAELFDSFESEIIVFIVSVLEYL
jgi:hypothetical protein